MLSTLESRSHCPLVVSLVGELVVVLTLVLLSVRAFGHFCGPLFPLLLLSGLGLGACAPASLIVPPPCCACMVFDRSRRSFLRCSASCRYVGNNTSIIIVAAIHRYMGQACAP